MTEYRGWIYIYDPQGGSDRAKDWEAWDKYHVNREILYAATESDIRKEIKQASKPQ